MKYTVVVAEDEELLLNNLVQKIQKADPDFQVTGTAQTGEQAFSHGRAECRRPVSNLGVEACAGVDIHTLQIYDIAAVQNSKV